MILIHNFCYRMKFGCGKDYWTGFGNVQNHPRFHDWDEIFVSKPVAFDKDNDILVTYSGSVYKIMSWADNREKVIGYIREDIAREMK